MSSGTDLALTALAGLRERFDWLEVNITTTSRVYRAPTLSPEQRAEMDAAAKRERHERVDIAPGDSPDPYRFDVTDLRDLILVTSDGIAASVIGHARGAAVLRKRRAWPQDMPDASWGDHAGVWLVVAAHHLEQAAEADPDLPWRVLRKCTQLVMRADSLLGNVLDGHVIPRPCPFCDGRTAHTPTGGAHTLRIRLAEGTEAIDDDTLIVCEGGRCEPGQGMYWKLHRGHPAWLLLNEYEWLVRCMEARDAGRTCPCGQPLPMTETAGRPVRWCSPECRRKADADRKAEMRAAA